MEVTLKTVLPGHHHPIYALEVESAEHFYTAGNDKGIVLWDAKNWKFEKVLYPLEHTVYVLKRLQTQNVLLAGDRSGQLHVIFLDQSQDNKRLHITNKAVFDIKTSPQEDLAFVSTENGQIYVFETNQWTEIGQIHVSEGPVRTMAVHPDSTQNLLVAGSKEGVLYVLDYRNCLVVSRIEAHDALVTAVAFDPLGTHLYSCGRDSQMKVFDWKSRELIHQWVPHLYAVYKIAFHPNMQLFATASRDKDVKIWSIPDMKLRKSISLQKNMPAHRLSVNNVNWTCEGKELISVSDDKMVLVWQIDLDHGES